METILGIFVGLVLIGGFAAFIDLVSKDNGQGRQGYQRYHGYQPNKPLEGPPPNKGNSVQPPPRAQRNKARLEIDQNYFYYDDIPIGFIIGDDPYCWSVRISKNLEARYDPRRGRLEILPIRGKEDKQ